MKFRKRRVILGVVVLAVLAASIGSWYGHYTSTEEYKARKLVNELRSLGKQPSIVTQWLIKLKLKRGRSSRAIQKDLVAIGEVAVPGLIEALKDKDDWIRYISAETLGRIGPAAGDATDPLIRALKDKNRYVRGSAVEALERIGSPAKEAVPALIQVLKDENEYIDVRWASFHSLKKIRPKAKEPIATLVEFYWRAEDPAVFTLISINQDIAGPEAVPVLVKTLKCEDPYLRSSAAEALGKIGPVSDRVIPALVHAMDDKSGSVQERASSALMVEFTFDGTDKQVIQVLKRNLKDPDGFVQGFACYALGKIGPAAKDAIPALIEVLKDEDNSARHSEAADALGRIAPAVAVKKAVPVLIKDLKDEDEDVRFRTAVALAEIAPATTAEKTVPILIRGLKEEFSLYRLWAASALGKIGPAAKDAIPALRKLLKDEREDVRKAASEALKKIEVKTGAE